MGFSKNGLPRTQRPIRLARTKGTWPRPHPSSPNKRRRQLESTFFEWAAPLGATFRERRKRGEGKKKRKREEKNHVTEATGIGLFLFPRLGRRRERLRAQLIIFRLGRGRENKKNEMRRWESIFRAGCGRKPSSVQFIFPVTIDFYSTWPRGNSQRRPAPAPRTRGHWN